MLWMEADRKLLHIDATYDHWSIAGRKEHIISIKNKKINQSATHSKSKNPPISGKVESLYQKDAKMSILGFDKSQKTGSRI